VHLDAYRRENVRYHRSQLERILHDVEAVNVRLETALDELRSDGGFEAVIADVEIAFKVGEHLEIVARRARASVVVAAR
jgi:hypothetical protein